MNKKLVYAPTINEKISSFAQALMEIFNFFPLVRDFWTTLYYQYSYASDIFHILRLILQNIPSSLNLPQNESSHYL